MTEERKDIKVPADRSLTEENFCLNEDGTVTIMNKELADTLKEKLENAKQDVTTTATSVGVVVGT